MAVYASSLKDPAGYLLPTWFSDTQLGIWIAEGVVKAASITDSTSQDEAVKAWAYHRAYFSKAQQKEDLPQSSSLSGVASTSYGENRSKMWEGEASRWLGVFNDHLAGTESVTSTYMFSVAPGRRGR